MNIKSGNLVVMMTLAAAFMSTGWQSRAADDLAQAFQAPPKSARPGVYWYFMDGNLNRKEMIADLESMKEAGLGNLVFLEVDIGMPKGPVKFMSPEWQEVFVQTVHGAERLGLDITLGLGPGWCGSGGPWIKPQQAMQHLVFSSVDLKGPRSYSEKLPLPAQRSTPWATMANPFYEDVAVFAFPSSKPVIADINEKALYDRRPYSLYKTVRHQLPSLAKYRETDTPISPDAIVDLTLQLKPDGTLEWTVPAGDWTVVRMGRRVTGAGTRPAPSAGLGLESDKFDAQALEYHMDQYVGKLLEKIGPRTTDHGLTTLHMDSWESGAQNWNASFLDEFEKRRGYSARPFLLAYTGRAVESREKTERFLWDLRVTAQELVLQNHAEAAKEWDRKRDLLLSIEPYDMNPAGDLDLGAVADVPMAEFWNNSMDTTYSCFEATSIAHVMGKAIVAGEAFTSGPYDGALDAYPWSLKNQGDWAFAVGINRFVFHTFPHQALGDAYKPGMTMGPFGVHWHRNQTWWPMVEAYHRYLSRCSEVLRRGVAVSDVLYLTPEGAPQIFLPPPSALEGKGTLADKRGYGFDGCSPKILIARAEVKDGLITFPGGTSYRLLVLPKADTMTPVLLGKIRDLVKDGATVVGAPPLKSPSLSGYPACDAQVQALAKELWGCLEAPATVTARRFGKGTLHWGRELAAKSLPLYPEYEQTAAVLTAMGLPEDFSSTGPVRYGHRRTKDREIYFVSNRTGNPIKADCRFRVGQGSPQLWDPVTGERRALPQFGRNEGVTTIPLKFEAFQSFFVVFDTTGQQDPSRAKTNFPELSPIHEIAGDWDVAFNPKWGGPEKVVFEKLSDWTTQTEPGIKYYSGIATYRISFQVSGLSGSRAYLDLGVVHDMARVRLNGKDLGVVWCAPWRVEAGGALKAGENQLEIDIVNRWTNRMIGDKQPADANARAVECPPGFLGGKKISTGRYTFSTRDPYKSTSPLLPSGLLGPVRVMAEQQEKP